MLIIYPAVIHNENGEYWAEFPDLVGCQTYGETLEETIIGAKEALEAYAISLLERGIKLPVASSAKTIEVDENSFVSLVDTDISAYLNSAKAVKKTLTIPQWLNDAAVKKGINFSQMLQDALLKSIY